MLRPGLAVAVLVGLVVAVVLVPTLLAVLGRWAFWPYGLSATPLSGPEAGPAGPAQPPDLDDPSVPAPAVPVARARPAGGSRLIRLLGNRWVAAVAAAGVIAVLVFASWPVPELRSAVSPVNSLPAGNPVRQAAAAASTGFTPGILSPTALIVSAPGLTDRRAALATLAGQLHRQPGVDIVSAQAARRCR